MIKIIKEKLSKEEENEDDLIYTSFGSIKKNAGNVPVNNTHFNSSSGCSVGEALNISDNNLLNEDIQRTFIETEEFKR